MGDPATAFLVMLSLSGTALGLNSASRSRRVAQQTFATAQAQRAAEVEAFEVQRGKEKKESESEALALHINAAVQHRLAVLSKISTTYVAQHEGRIAAGVESQVLARQPQEGGRPRGDIVEGTQLAVQSGSRSGSPTISKGGSQRSTERYRGRRSDRNDRTRDREAADR